VKTVWCGGLAWDIVGGGFMSIDIYVCERDQTSHEFSIDGSAKTRASKHTQKNSPLTHAVIPGASSVNKSSGMRRAPCKPTATAPSPSA